MSMNATESIRKLGSFRAAWPYLRRWAWSGLCLLVTLGFILTVVRPFGGPPPAPQADDIITAWNESIGRLGIEPVYPPQEDIQPGDVYAAVAEGPEDLRKVMVPIAHLNLRPAILDHQRRRLMFAETVPAASGAEARGRDRFETVSDPDRVGLTLVAFPGISFRHAIHGGASARVPVAGLTGDRRTSAIEEIRIPSAETYGVDAPAAQAEAMAWCHPRPPRAEGANPCDDAQVRWALSGVLGPAVFAPDRCGAVPTLILRVVHKVYLAREIVQRRVDEDSRGASAGASPNGVTEAPAPTGPGQDTGGTGGGTGAATVNAQIVNQGTAPGATAHYARSSGVDMGIRTTFQRPVVFGYRMINLAPNNPPVPAPETRRAKCR